jgi:hypothetical protein
LTVTRAGDEQKDPKVWSVKVANGTEKTIVMQVPPNP